MRIAFILLLALAAKAPRGLVYALSPRSGKNTKKGTDYPEELTRLERKGMVQGPLAALRSVRAARAYERNMSDTIGGTATS